jgi:hypothetical protein
VWTLVRLPRSTRSVFLAVLKDCRPRPKVIAIPKRRRRRNRRRERLPKAA